MKAHTKKLTNLAAGTVEIPGEPANLPDEEFRYVAMSREWRDELLEPKGWHTVLETFAGTMKLAVALTDPEGLLLGESHNPQPTWRLAHAAKPEAPAGCPFCLNPPTVFCSAVRDALRTDTVVTVEDQAGLSHVAVPLSLGGQKLGTLIAGQVFSHYPDPMQVQRTAREMGIAWQPLWQRAIQQVPVTRATLQLYANLLLSLAQAFLGQRYAAILHRKLDQTTHRYRIFIDGVKDYALHTVDRAGRVTSWNRGAERLFGYTEAEILGKDSSRLVVPGSVHRMMLRKAMVEAERSGSIEYEGWWVRKDGTRFFGAGVLASMGRDDAREYGGLIRDVTELRRSEHDLQQAQKLEAIGVIAGGIAHDFNNLLAGIIGGLGLVKASLPQDGPLYPILEIAEQSGTRAAELVAQLLAYAGKGQFVITRFDLSALIAAMLPLLATSIPKLVKLELSLAPGLPWIEADASQIRQVVMNLIINGAEAIGAEGGTVRVVTGVSRPGTHVFMEVKDSGCGMTETTKAKMFDPFFTTKFTGRGLGLAAVAGIVRSHKGKMHVDSIPGQGTIFTVSFPSVPANSPRPVEPPSSIVSRGSGTILVVDDEPALRKLAGAVLERAGYSVLVAKDGQEAVDVFRQNAAVIAAVLLDITMPVMGGHQAFELIREIRLGVPIIISSGYDEESAREKLGLEAVARFVQKPYSSTKLVAAIQAAMQQSTATGGS